MSMTGSHCERLAVVTCYLKHFALLLICAAYKFTDIYLVTFIKMCFIFDHPWSSMVYNFGRVCLYVCMYVCQTTTFESLDTVSSYLHIQCISNEYGSSSYMKIMGSRSRSHEPKKVENSYSRNVKLPSAITPVLSNTEPWCLRAAGDFRVSQVEWCNCHLYHMTGSEHA